MRRVATDSFVKADVNVLPGIGNCILTCVRMTNDFSTCVLAINTVKFLLSSHFLITAARTAVKTRCEVLYSRLLESADTPRGASTSLACLHGHSASPKKLQCRASRRPVGGRKLSSKRSRSADMHAHQPASSPQRPLVWPASAPPPLVGGVRFVSHDRLCTSEHNRSVLDRTKKFTTRLHGTQCSQIRSCCTGRLGQTLLLVLYQRACRWDLLKWRAGMFADVQQLSQTPSRQQQHRRSAHIAVSPTVYMLAACLI